MIINNDILIKINIKVIVIKYKSYIFISELKTKDMKTIEQQLEDYNEAKAYCESYINYVGDKRRSVYIRLSNGVVLASSRMTHFGRILGLPTYQEYFFD